MLRRTLLTAVIALPASRASAMAGSSVAPVGMVRGAQRVPSGCGSKRNWQAQCPLPPVAPLAVSGWTAQDEWNLAYASYAAAVGAKPFPQNTTHNVSEEWFRANLSPGEYADLSDLINLANLGGIIGGAYGLRRGGTRGAAIGAVLGTVVGSMFWAGWQGGTLVYNLGVQADAPTSFHYNGGYSVAPMSGIYSSGVSFGWTSFSFNVGGPLEL